jgi:hypothetical protein
VYVCIMENEGMTHTKEFYETMKAFEANAQKWISLGSMGLTKEPKESWLNQQYYCDGNANNAFKMFLIGVSFGKTL